MVQREWTEFRRYPVALASLAVQIVFIVLLFTYAVQTFALGVSSEQGRVFAALSAFGLVIFMFLSFVLWEIGFGVREEQVRGTLESLYLAPSPKFGHLVARVFALLVFAATFSMLGVVLIGASVGGLAFHNVLLALVILAFSLAGMLGIGFLLAGLTLRLKETAALIVAPLQFAIMILAAVFFPFRSMPSALVDYGSRLVPVSYAVDAFRSVLVGLPPGYPELLPLDVELVVVVAFGVLMPFAGYAFYKLMERDARRRGSLGEY